MHVGSYFHYNGNRLNFTGIMGKALKRRIFANQLRQKIGPNEMLKWINKILQLKPKSNFIALIKGNLFTCIEFLFKNWT